MMKRLLQVLLLLVAVSDSPAEKMDLTRPELSFPTGYPEADRQEILAALRHPDCTFVRGQAVNWITILHYRGDTEALNGMLRALQNVDGAGLKITQQTNAVPDGSDWMVLHMGHRPELTFYVNPASQTIDVAQLEFPLYDPASPPSVRVNSGRMKTYSPEGERWSFEMPTDAKIVRRSESHEGPEAPVAVSIHCFDRPGVRCQLRYFDLPRSEEGVPVPELLGRYCLPSWGDADKLTTGPTVKLGGLEGNEYRVAGKNPVRLRVFRVDDRVFVLSAATAADPLPGATQTARAFLNSFRILPAVGGSSKD